MQYNKQLYENIPMKIYTKTGDQGDTGLTGGKRVSKRSCTIEAIGSVDELNAALGAVAVSKECPESLQGLLKKIQSDCFVLGADLAAPMDAQYDTLRIAENHVKNLEDNIDYLTKDLPALDHFILPGGGEVGAYLHLARAICRRAERAVVRFEQEEIINPLDKQYLNRLSDLLFTLARWVNWKHGVEEEIWQR